MKELLHWTWCLPQTILGLFVFMFAKIQASPTRLYKGAYVTYWKYKNGLSLGPFIFVPYNGNEAIIKHEYGHYVDGLCLGPLFLLVIGIPSICWLVFGEKYRRKNGVSYYDFYTESRADKLGEE